MKNKNQQEYLLTELATRRIYKAKELTKYQLLLQMWDSIKPEKYNCSPKTMAKPREKKMTLYWRKFASLQDFHPGYPTVQEKEQGKQVFCKGNAQLDELIADHT